MQTTVSIQVDLKDFSAFKLCYVEGCFAYFTTAALDSQWGDDWDDAPYEHNAGRPYLPTMHYYANGQQKLSPRDWNLDGTPKYQLLAVSYGSHQDGADFLTPCDLAGSNSPYSVQAINRGEAPWLTARGWVPAKKEFEVFGQLFAGASVPDFFEFVKKYGGNLYFPDTGLTPYPSAKPSLPFIDVV